MTSRRLGGPLAGGTSRAARERREVPALHRERGLLYSGPSTAVRTRFKRHRHLDWLPCPEKKPGAKDGNCGANN